MEDKCQTWETVEVVILIRKNSLEDNDETQFNSSNLDKN